MSRIPKKTVPPGEIFQAEAGEPWMESIAAVEEAPAIKWRGEVVHVSSSLVGEAVGVEETEAGDWRVLSSMLRSA